MRGRAQHQPTFNFVFTTMNNSLAKPPAHIAFTTPSNYSDRLSTTLRLNLNPPPQTLWCPTVTVESTPRTKQSIKPYLTPTTLQHFSAIAFTSRTGIAAFSQTLLDSDHHIPPLSSTLPPNSFTVAALGRDAELLNSHFISSLCSNPSSIRVLVPPVATPTALVESLGTGLGRRVLCPVPEVIGLKEPPVVPDFLQALSSKGWVPVRVSAYETRWAGPNCAASLVGEGVEVEVDAIVFTSTAEVEGLLKSLRVLGFEWEMIRKRWPRLVVAAHGPVTAAGAESLGVAVDVVGSSFGSFDGVVEALSRKLGYQQ